MEQCAHRGIGGGGGGGADVGGGGGFPDERARAGGQLLNQINVVNNLVLFWSLLKAREPL